MTLSRRQMLQLLAAAPALRAGDGSAQSLGAGQSSPASAPATELSTVPDTQTGADSEFPRRALIEAPYENSFSSRFMIHEVRDVFDYLDLCGGFDGIAVNIYPSNDTWELDAGEREYLTLIHEKTGKPIIITERSVPARDSGLYDDPAHLHRSFPQTMATQQERARQSAEILAEFYNMPFVIGAHWFSWSDFDSQQRHANRGLFEANNQPWPELQGAFKDWTALMGAQAEGKGVAAHSLHGMNIREADAILCSHPRRNC